MTSPIDALIEQARAGAARANQDPASRADERQRLEKLATEFESTLMLQMLRDMRRAGRWNDDESVDTGETQSIFEMLDAEFAAQMSRVQGFGMTKQLLDTFDRLQGTAPAPAGSDGSRGVSSVPPAGVAAALGMPGEEQPEGWVRAADVTSAFGWRRDPLTGEARFHRGIDVRAAYGQDVAVPAAGQVRFSGTQGDYGTTVLVEHADGTRTRYAHLSVALVQAGDVVRAGDVIGRAGSTGRATGPHVHVEVLGADGRQIDPMEKR